MGLGFATASTIASVGVLFGSSQLVVGPDAVPRFLRDGCARNLADLATGLRVGD
jgi:hypothetical protein